MLVFAKNQSNNLEIKEGVKIKKAKNLDFSRFFASHYQ